MALPDRAANLLAWFETERLHDRPLIFVGHSLGGLVIKQLLRLGADRPGTAMGRLATATQGVVLLATPNTGSDLASWMDRLQVVLGASSAIKDLQSESPYLRELNGWYRERIPREDIATLVFAETRPTKGMMVVEQTSADPGIPGVLPIPVDADHLSIVKPADRGELVYRRVRQFIEERLPPEKSSVATAPHKGPRRFFISYRRRAKDDAMVAKRLHDELTKAGHEVFIDVQMVIGMEWGRQIESRIDWCDFLVVLLSAESIQSEMVQEEVRLAHQRRKRDGTPYILPIRIRHEGPLGYGLGAYIERYQFALWSGEQDTAAIVAQVLKAPEADIFRTAQSNDPAGQSAGSSGSNGLALRPAAAADPRLLKHPGGAVNMDDPAYVARATDRRVSDSAKQQGVTLVVKAPRQYGKTSLLIRYVALCREQGKQVALVDFQIFTRAQLDDLATCLTRLARSIVRELGLDPSHHKEIHAPDELTDFMEDVIFAKVGMPITFGFDEVDRLIVCPWRDDFFAMLRHWHNLRSMRPARGWGHFDLALVAATEPTLLITDARQSPFNVGERVRPNPFDRNDLLQLNQRYGDPLDGNALKKLAELVGGQPYLSRLAFFLLATESQLSFGDLLGNAARDGGPFDEHLRARLSELTRYPELCDSFRLLLKKNVQPATEIGHRLEALGLVRQEVAGRLVVMSLLYVEYFGRVL
jgi:hypothetical protein